MTRRIHNFSAGPAVLPEPVLEEARDNMLSLGKSGLGIMEISHRTKLFEDILHAAIRDFSEIAGVPQNYRVLLLQGGATLQFSMVPMNLLGPGRTADYIVTGTWSEKAVEEARRVGEVHVAADTTGDKHNRIPAAGEIRYSKDPAYVHFTSNNTIFGTQWPAEPAGADGLLVCDASSDVLSRPLDVSKYALFYAGAQKNLGPSGVTVVVIREDLLERGSEKLPIYMNYRVHAREGSLYNTPNTWGVYVLGLVLKWVKKQGGLAGLAENNRRKARLIYDVIDAGGFYRGHARQDARSLMNVTFRLPDEKLEKKFVEESEAAGMTGLKGHRSVGGIRASLYNACPLESAKELARFMRDFEAKHA